jgi:hypothetical protein
MNKAFKVVWNSLRRQFVVVNETQMSRKKRKSTLVMTALASSVLAASVANAAFINNTVTGVASDFTSAEDKSSGELSNSIANEKDGGYAIETTTAGAVTFYHPKNVTLTSDKGGINTIGAGSALYLGVDSENYEEAITDSIIINLTSSADTATANLFAVRASATGENYLAADQIDIKVNGPESSSAAHGIANFEKSTTEIQSLTTSVSSQGANAFGIRSQASSVSLIGDSLTVTAVGKKGYAYSVYSSNTENDSSSVDLTSTGAVSIEATAATTAFGVLGFGGNSTVKGC